MFKFPILCIFTSLYTLLGASMLGKGLWTLVSMSQCPEEGLTTLRIDYKKHKLNRTQETITAHISITKEITKSYGLYIEVCQFVDGGCKPYQIIAGNLGQLCDKYGKEFLMEVLKKAKCKNEYFPIPVGEYDVEDYFTNSCSLPRICVFGKFGIKVYLLYNLKRVACFMLESECKKCEEGQYCCDD